MAFVNSPKNGGLWQAVAAAERAAAAVPMTSEKARQQAQAERLTLLVAKNKTGYFGVNLDKRTKANPYEVRMRRGGKKVSLGCFATAEEAALHVARSPEGQAAVQKAAAATRPLTSEEKRKGSFVYKEEGLVPPMPPGAYTKVEIVVLKEEESSGSRPKRQRPKKVTALWRRLSSSGSGHGSGTGAWGWAFFFKLVLINLVENIKRPVLPFQFYPSSRSTLTDWQYGYPAGP